MKNYDAYLFDWDGTIGQTLHAWLEIKKRTLATYHISLSDKQIVQKMFGRGSAGLADVGIPEKDFQKIFRIWDAEAKAQMLHAPLYPGVRELLALLRQRGKKLAVITSTIRPTLQQALDTHNLHDAFDVTITGDEVRTLKPHPEGILAALAQLGVPGNRALMVGDSEKDILAAHNAGIDSLLYYPPEHKIFHDLAHLQASNPTYTTQSWNELVNQLQ